MVAIRERHGTCRAELIYQQYIVRFCNNCILKRHIGHIEGGYAGCWSALIIRIARGLQLIGSDTLRRQARCDAFKLGPKYDPFRNVVVLRLMIAPLWGALMPLMALANARWQPFVERAQRQPNVERVIMQVCALFTFLPSAFLVVPSYLLRLYFPLTPTFY